MSRCISVSGYLAVFDIQEPDAKYRLTKSLANQIIENNEHHSIPLVISHIDFRVDLTIGYVTDLKVDNKGLYCKGIIDNIAFIDVQNQMNEDFITYFTKSTPSPFLYLKSCLSCFSLAHDKNSHWIKHVALVDLGARRGTLVRYEYASNRKPKEYTNERKDFYIVLGCYSRNALKLGHERNELLFKDAMICGETDTDFICAGKEVSKKTIKGDLNDFSRKRQNYSSNMEPNQNNNLGLNEALTFISTIASALNQRQNNKHSYDTDPESTPRKRMKVDDEPIVNAAQTLVSAEPQQYPQLSRDEINDFKKQMQEMKQMQTDFITAQSNMFRMMNPYGIQNQLQHQINPQLQNGMNCFLPSQQPVVQTHAWPPMQTQPTKSTFATQSSMQNALSQQQLAQNASHDQQDTIKPIPSEQTSQACTVQASQDTSTKQSDITQPTQNKHEKKTAENTLIEAGIKINESEHLINELFKHFIETNFSVKSHMNVE